MNFQLNRYDEVGSTNDVALEAARSGAEDGLVVWAQRQTRGRGQRNHTWESQPQSSLTFSVLFRPNPEEMSVLGRFTALGALSVAQAVKAETGNDAKVKWPNDVLLNGKKICGVLAETDLQLGKANAVVVGVGVNLLPGAFEAKSAMNYPASDIFSETGFGLNAETWLWVILEKMQTLRQLLPDDAFIREWNSRLAFRGEIRRIRNHKGETGLFRLLGVLKDGSLRVEDANGQQFGFQSAEVLSSSSSSAE
jgi:BirA family biotin operon repressor/biotin-[acetyl-CoA-carboxylase] ligase